MSKWHLAAITPHDMDEIVNLDRHAFNRPWKRNLFLKELTCKDAYSYAVKWCRTDNTRQMIAYLFSRIILNEWHIIRIAVAPEFRARGVATWLLQQCFKLGMDKEADSVLIEVRPSNTPAVALYQKLGFVLIGRRPNYYSDSKEDAWVMKKNLKEKP